MRCARRAATAAAHFIGGDPDDGPMPMDCFVWVCIRESRAIVVDTSFAMEVAAKRKSGWLRCPVESLRLLGLEPEAVEDVVLAHLHHDHVGSFHLFPKARFHLPKPEMHSATRRCIRHAHPAHSFEVEDGVGNVRMNFAGRVRFHDGVVEPRLGLWLHPTGGPSAGLQFVLVDKARGRAVLATGITLFCANMEEGRRFSTAFQVGDMLEGFDRGRAIATSEAHIISGRDPLVMARYPASGAGWKVWACPWTWRRSADRRSATSRRRRPWASGSCW